MYPPRCQYAKDGFHEMTIIGTPRSAMTYWHCRICDGRWQRGMGAFHGMTINEPKTLEQRVAALEAAIDRTADHA